MNQGRPVRFTRLRIALALAGISVKQLGERIRNSESNILRAVKAYRDRNGKVYRSAGLLLKVDDFIKEQFEQHAQVLDLKGTHETIRSFGGGRGNSPGLPEARRRADPGGARPGQADAGHLRTAGLLSRSPSTNTSEFAVKVDGFNTTPKG